MEKVISRNELANLIKESITIALGLSDKSSQYECLTEAKSTISGQRLNSFPRIISERSKCILSEGIEWQPNEKERGGIIVFSTDVNAVELDPNKLKNWIKQKIATLKNRLTFKNKIDKVAHSNVLFGWTIGRYLNGRYKAKNGNTFSENSLSVEIIGIDTNRLITIAEDLCREFQQESVLVKDYSNGNIFFVNPQ